MSRPSEDEKDRFLEYIKGGDDRATAAWRINPEYTGSMFRAMCNPHSRAAYDEEFAQRYEDACAVRGPLDPQRQQIQASQREGQTTTLQGFTKAMYLSDEQLEEFLELVRDGVQAATAAGELDPPTSITQINRRAARDADFNRELNDALSEGYTAYQARLRSEAARQAFAGDYRALRDQMIMHLEDARKALTTNRTEIGGIDGNAIRVLAERHFSDLPPDMLEEMIRTVEQRELGIGEPE